MPVAVTATSQTLTLPKYTEFVQNSVNIYTCVFTLDSSWNNYTCYAVFRNENIETSYEIPLDNNHSAVVPYEALVKTGRLYVGLYGEYNGTVMPTLWANPITVMPGTDTDGDSPSEYESKYDTLIEHVEDIDDDIDALEETVWNHTASIENLDTSVDNIEEILAGYLEEVVSTTTTSAQSSYTYTFNQNKKYRNIFMLIYKSDGTIGSSTSLFATTVKFSDNSTTVKDCGKAGGKNVSACRVELDNSHIVSLAESRDYWTLTGYNPASETASEIDAEVFEYGKTASHITNINYVGAIPSDSTIKIYAHE